MPELKLKQLKFESETCKRLLDFMMDENIQLKNRLSEVLKDQFDKNLLDDVERFQSHFIKEDQLIGLMRNDIAELDALLIENLLDEEMSMQNVDLKLKRLRNNIKNAEMQFSNLKLDFYNYLSENLKYGQNLDLNLG